MQEFSHASRIGALPGKTRFIPLHAEEAAGPQDVSVEEVFLGENNFQTYRNGRWKSTRSREDGILALFDLETDPGETVDVVAQHPEIAAEHERRLDEIATQLAKETDLASVEFFMGLQISRTV
jgi:arylsulfatase A-like enzyme